MDNLERTMMGFRCRDCDFIPKVADAGRVLVENGKKVQVMHNGLRVEAGGYYGDWMAHLIRGLRGHHEPQEEALFHEIVRRSQHGALFIELGSFWAYYTLWFLNDVPGSRAICIEPDAANIEVGKRNAALNGFVERIQFLDGAASGSPGPLSVRGESTGESRELEGYDVPSLVGVTGGQKMEVLHVDVQGAETQLLRSLPERTGDHIRFLVVSTHHSSISGSASTHRDCLACIRDRGGFILAEHSVEQSFSGDGLIVASFLPADRHAPFPKITRNKGRHLFSR